MIAPNAGILLIADPFLKDPNFLRTVVLLCNHNDEGSFGFVLNKQIDQSISDLLNNFDGIDFPVYYGGPVQMDTLHFLHQYPHLIPDSVFISDNLYWGGNFETVKALLKNKIINPNKIKFFIGYSGWSKGQLEEEINEKSWLTVSATTTLVFDTAYNQVWKESLQHLGGDYTMLQNYPLDPQLN